MQPFRAFVIEQDGGKTVSGRFARLTESDLDAGDVLIRVAWSSVNYKDALAVTGRGRIVRRYPCVAGIDLAGVVVESAAPRFRPGDAVLATSYELGVGHHGGYSEYALVPGGWVLPLPDGMNLRDAMVIGTAGFSAALAVTRMEDNGLKPEAGPVLVTGASGGVGSLAIDMLAGRGYEVVALTGKPHLEPWLRRLGAARLANRADLDLSATKPLDKGLWSGAVDNLGGDVLAWVLSSMKPAGVLASVGLAAGHELKSSVMPFVLRGVSVLGVDSAYTGFAVRERVWGRLAGDLRPRHLEAIAREIAFDELQQACGALVDGQGQGRIAVRIGGEGVS